MASLVPVSDEYKRQEEKLMGWQVKNRRFDYEKYLIGEGE